MPAQVRIDPTPNPNSLKITVSAPVSTKPVTYASPEAAAADPLARKLFEIEGVKSVFLLNNFVTVTKSPEADWNALAAKLGDVIASHFP
jgi:hypothetical protein